MAADDRLKVIARHLGAGKNVFQTSAAMHLCSSQNQSLERVHGGVALPIGPPSDARKPRSTAVDSVIPKNRYDFLLYLCCVAQYFLTLFLSVLLRHSAMHFLFLMPETGVSVHKLHRRW
jgi:hypothetical protein